MLEFPSRQAARIWLLLTFVAATALASSPPGSGDWILLAPTGEGFSVKMPVKPQVETQRVPVMGNTYLLRLYTGIDDANGLLYMVVMQEYDSVTGVLTPAVRLESFMNGFKKGLGESLATAVGGKFDLVLARELTLAGKPGRQYRLTVGESRGLVRAFDAGRRVYLLMILGAEEKNPAAVTFFDSFAIKPAPDPVPQPIDKQ
ncbi:MAG TPA: hypothetical protein VGW76_05660 [Pyrinomonadaceae bacterium]|nr:hypothetical protein [Pyrinomonadaceae bacterium]